MIEYRDTAEGIASEMLGGFFEGWVRPPSPQHHLNILWNSSFVVLAVDPQANTVVGFITALTDHVQSAFIPLLEVLPEYRGQGVGSELVRRMLARLEDLPAIDLMCNPELQGFYQRFGMQPSVGMIIRNYR